MTAENCIKKHLGFLTKEYGLNYIRQEFGDYMDFHGPAECFSFYNSDGCFTLHHLEQRGEWGWFYAPQFCKSQDGLLKTEIDQQQYIHGRVFGYRHMLRLLGKSIQRQITESGGFFGISVVKEQLKR